MELKQVLAHPLPLVQLQVFSIQDDQIFPQTQKLSTYRKCYLMLGIFLPTMLRMGSKASLELIKRYWKSPVDTGYVMMYSIVIRVYYASDVRNIKVVFDTRYVYTKKLT